MGYALVRIGKWNTDEEFDWSSRIGRLAGHRNLFSAGGKINFSFKVLNGRVLRLLGVRIDHVCSVSVALTSKEDMTVAKIGKEWSRFHGLDSPDLRSSNYVSGGTVLDAFHRTLINDARNVVRYSPWRRCTPEDFDLYLDWMREGARIPWEKDRTSASLFQKSFDIACGGRRTFNTEKGLIRVGPANMANGDVIYTIAGGTNPLVLRPPSPSKTGNRFELVGDCYVDGIMDGQAVEGMSVGYFDDVFLQ